MKLRLLLAVLFVAAVAGVSIAYAYRAPKRYDATARVVVHPVPAGDTTYTGIDVLVDSRDEARVIETAAHYFDTPEVIGAVATRLSLSPSTVRDALDVHPLGGSNILLVVGKSRHRDLAAQIANATVQSRPAPTLQTLSAATAPSRAAWPKPREIITAASVAALVLAALFLLLPPLVRRRPPAVDEGREQALAEREGELAQRERALAEASEALEQRERELREREQAPPPGAARLEQRIAAVTAREAAMAKQAAQLTLRERALDSREGEFREREEELERREQEPPPEPEQAEAGEPGAWRIEELERLVAERGARYPDRLEEWRYYVHFLREHAAADGTLPASFDYLIDETFAELL